MDTTQRPVEPSAEDLEDLQELEFSPLSPEQAIELEDGVYLLGAPAHGVRPL